MQYALDNLKFKKDNKFVFEEFTAMHQIFPAILFPAFRFQGAMMDAVAGEKWWLSKKTELAFAKEALGKREDRIVAREKREAERETLGLC